MVDDVTPHNLTRNHRPKKIAVTEDFETIPLESAEHDTNELDSNETTPKTFEATDFMDDLYTYEPDKSPDPHHLHPGDDCMRNRDTSAESIYWKWHDKSGHIHKCTLKSTSKHSTGMEELSKQPKVPKLRCDKRARAKSHSRNKIKHTSKCYQQVGYKFHTDMSGKIQTKSLQGASYFVRDTVFLLRTIKVPPSRSYWGEPHTGGRSRIA
eukprot:3501484-Rhodomonas_salina.2